MSTDPFALLRAAAVVQHLDDDLTVHPGDRQRERTYLVHRAALADRAVPALAEVEAPQASEQDAQDTARRLLEHDRAHGTGRGPVPAADARWDTDARGYARQEHAAAVLDEHETEHARG
jgi:isoaspartyl peptidase/L-asparaginase-like protein (Ntn-hydrolase superfamily)